MPGSEPPPETIPRRLVDLLEGCDARTLRDVARYAERLAERRARERRPREADDEDRSADDEDRSEGVELPDGVPSKATITVKEINDNRYYYWQWRDGETVRSKYEGPVDSDP